MAVQMIALKPHRYAGKALQAGEEFIVGGASQARVLAALGRAALCPPLAPVPEVQKAPETPAPVRRRRKSSDPTAEQTESAPEAPPQPEVAPYAPDATDPAQEAPPL